MKKINIDDVLPPKQKHLATVFRRYPRTLAEAFPYDLYYANPIIHPLQDNFDWYSKIILNLVLFAAMVVVILDLFVWRL
jgi:hypothetical protein